MTPNWQSFNLETFPSGVSSAVSPDLLPDNTTAWGGNISIRGSKIQTRPSIGCRQVLPTGLFQGAGYFSAQNGMIIVMISGIPYRIRINPTTYSYETIPLPWNNSGVVKQSYFTQTVETIIIQDGQSSPILYNGSVARRAGVLEVPLGKQMAYGNGRLWVAVGNKRLVAGDIRTNAAYSELKFTEVNYLTGGGSLYYPAGITGLAFIPVTGTSDYGTLLVFGQDYTVSIRADWTARDDWGTMPGFQTNVLRNIGAASQWSKVAVNQDLFWRDSNGGIRSIKSSVQDESGPGNSPISREVDRLVDFDAQQLLEFCSGIYINNRLLMTSSPYLNVSGGVSWKNLVSLDFAPISTMQGKSLPAYNGQWNGVQWAQLVSGKFNGMNRGFGISSDSDGINRLWELDIRDTADLSLSCGSSAGLKNDITAWVEYPRIDFGAPKERKRIERCDVWLSEINGAITLTAYWRSDNAQKWSLWDSVEVCAQVEDPATNTPHTWKNLLPEQRPQIKTFTIPDAVDDVVKFSTHVGFQFQVRLVWSGRCKIERTMLHATVLDQQDYANRETVTAECIPNDVTGNEVDYAIPLDPNCGVINLCDRLAGKLPRGTWTASNPVLGLAIDNEVTPPTFILPDYGEYVVTDGERAITIHASVCSGFGYEALFRNRAGPASLCGFPSNNPTIPPIYYLNRNTTGILSLCQFIDAECTNLCGQGVTMSGEYTVTTPASHFSYIVTFYPTGPESGGFIPYTLDYHVTFISGSTDFGFIFRLPGRGMSLAPGNYLISTAGSPTSLAGFEGFNSFPGFFGIALSCVTITYLPSTRDTWNQLEAYSSDACILMTSGSSGEITSVDGHCPPQTGTDVGLPPLPPTFPHFGTVTTDTTIEYVGDDVCVQINPPLGPHYWNKTTGIIQRILSTPDTEANALNRAFGGPENGWTPYLSNGSSGCNLPECTFSGSELRTGQSFDAEQAQWKMTATGLSPSVNYKWRIQTGRRVWGSTDDFVLFSTQYFPVTVTSGGTASITNQNVEFESGFQSAIISAVLVKL